MARERIMELDRAKGLGIFLVVLGHLVATTPPANVVWYPLLQEQIYLFHMPFFMFVSGAIAGYAWKPLHTLSDYFTFVRRRAERLLPAYFLFAAIVFAGKLTAQTLTRHVDNPVGSLWSFFDLILFPYQSFSRYLWFVFVLFLLYALLPVLLKIAKNRAEPLLIFAAILQFLPKTPLFGLANLAEYLFLFLVGFFALVERDEGQRSYQTITAHLDRWWPAWMAIFIAGLILTHERILGDIFHFGNHENFSPYKILFGLLSVPALLGFCRSRLASNSTSLLTFGKYTFAIYLMNTMAIGAVKAIMLAIFPWNGNNFLIYAPILLAAGLFFPIVAKRHLFSRMRYLDKITD